MSPSEPLLLDCFGVLVRVLPPDATARGRWVEQWARVRTDRPEEHVDVTVDPRTPPAGDEDGLDYLMSTRVTGAALGAAGQDRICLHAAGLADAEGRVVALVAASGTGKTTAARALGGVLGYVSDETVAVGRGSLEVAPFAKPLSVVRSPDQPYRKTQRGPDELGLGRPPRTCRLDRVVLLERDPEGPHGLTRATVTEALPLVIPQTSYLTSFATPILDLARPVGVSGGPWVLRYAEIDEHVTELVGLLDGATGVADALVHHAGRPAEPTAAAGHLARVPWHDAVEVGDEVVVMAGGLVYRLDNLAATIWLALDRPLSLEELCARAVERHGPHEEARARVSAAVDAMAGHPLLRRL